jgi:hypothetical protein
MLCFAATLGRFQSRATSGASLIKPVAEEKLRGKMGLSNSDLRILNADTQSTKAGKLMPQRPVYLLPANLSTIQQCRPTIPLPSSQSKSDEKQTQHDRVSPPHR